MRNEEENENDKDWKRRKRWVTEERDGRQRKERSNDDRCLPDWYTSIFQACQLSLEHGRVGLSGAVTRERCVPYPSMQTGYCRKLRTLPCVLITVGYYVPCIPLPGTYVLVRIYLRYHNTQLMSSCISFSPGIVQVIRCILVLVFSSFISNAIQSDSPR